MEQAKKTTEKSSWQAIYISPLGNTLFGYNISGINVQSYKLEVGKIDWSLVDKVSEVYFLNPLTQKDIDEMVAGGVTIGNLKYHQAEAGISLAGLKAAVQTPLLDSEYAEIMDCKKDHQEGKQDWKEITLTTDCAELLDNGKPAKPNSISAKLTKENGGIHTTVKGQVVEALSKQEDEEGQQYHFDKRTKYNVDPNWSKVNSVQKLIVNVPLTEELVNSLIKHNIRINILQINSGLTTSDLRGLNVGRLDLDGQTVPADIKFPERLNSLYAQGADLSALSKIEGIDNVDIKDAKLGEKLHISLPNKAAFDPTLILSEKTLRSGKIGWSGCKSLVIENKPEISPESIASLPMVEKVIKVPSLQYNEKGEPYISNSTSVRARVFSTCNTRN